jgi:hypothetical protein
VPEVTPYLLASVTYLAVALLLARLTLSRRQARLTAWSGAVHLPAALLAPLLEPSYWAPVRTGGVAFGFEDVLITLAVAVWAWYLVALRFDARLGTPATLRVAFRRSLLPGAVIIGGFLLAWTAGVDPMTALLVVCLLAAVALGALRPDRRELAAWGSLSLSVAWFGLVWATYALAPGFAAQWNGAGAWAVRLAGVPLGEVAWAAAFGAFWPVFLAHVFDVALVPGPAGARSRRSARPVAR